MQTYPRKSINDYFKRHIKLCRNAITKNQYPRSWQLNKNQMEIGQFKAFEKLPELRPKLAKLFNDYFVGLNLNADEYEIIIDANTKLLSGAELYLNSWFHRNIFYEKKVVDKLLRNKCIDIQNMIDLFDTICEYFTDLNELLCEKKELGGRTLIYQLIGKHKQQEIVVSYMSNELKSRDWQIIRENVMSIGYELKYNKLESGFIYSQLPKQRLQIIFCSKEEEIKNEKLEDGIQLNIDRELRGLVRRRNIRGLEEKLRRFDIKYLEYCLNLRVKDPVSRQRGRVFSRVFWSYCYHQRKQVRVIQ